MTRPTRAHVLVALASSAFLFSACGDDDAPAIDAAQADAPLPDGNEPTGCGKLATPITTLSSFPATYTGSLAGATSLLQVAVACTFQEAPAGATTIGPEQVVALTGLTPGTTYYAKAESPDADLVIAVITGCSEGAIPGPGTGECLGLSDIVVTGHEIVPFVAPAGGVVHLVVDSVDDSTPNDPAFTVTVDTESCLSNADCEAEAPFCNPGFVCEVTDTCANDPECPVDAPFCEESLCTSHDLCVDDDTVAEERSDDSPLGATPLELGGGTAIVSAKICTDPRGERDYYSFTVVDGASVTLVADWSEAGADLDLYVYDAEQNELAVSWFEKPEDIAVTFLPAGTYYLRVERYQPATSAVTAYTVTATLTSSKCSSNADCAEAFEDQLIRGSCDPLSGVCGPLETGGTVAAGGICDSDDDCAGEFCASFPYTADADTRYICTTSCTSDTDCTAVATTAKCTSGFAAVLGSDYCLLPCTSDEQCPANLGVPPVSGPWSHSACTEGRCVFP